MKKIVLLLLAVFAVSSCSLDDGGENDYYFEVLPVDSFEIPESFVQGRIHPMKIFYKLPTNCHQVTGFYYAKEGNTRIVGIQSRVLYADYCLPLETQELDSLTFNFEAGTEDSYIFKFYKGTDEQGIDTFEEVEIPAYPYQAPAGY